ncbi:MAG: type II toxin-antitoxin system HicA family toxin [Ahrensia sp.]|nr:type II toxin-antitoxin system HicA family toxin [Ahrensia sp.]
MTFERDSRKLIKMLEDDGWTLLRVKGSHHHFHKKGHRHIVTVPHPRKDISPGVCRAIYQAAGWKN